MKATRSIRERKEAYRWAKQDQERLGLQNAEEVWLRAPNDLSAWSDDSKWWFSLFHDEKLGETLYRTDDLKTGLCSYGRVVNFAQLRFQENEFVNALLDAGVWLCECNYESIWEKPTRGVRHLVSPIPSECVKHATG